MLATEGVERQIKEYMQGLSKHALERISQAAHKEIKRKYAPHSRKPKYGNLSKYIPKNKWAAIYAAARSDKFRFIFWLMKKLALRVGEVPDLNLKDIDLEHKEILVQTEKSGMPDIRYLDDEAANRLRTWIFAQYDAILAHSGYIFFGDASSHSSRIKLSKNTIRNEFREACLLANVQIAYGCSVNIGRALNLYTTHSLRHTGITDFYLRTKDLVKTQIYARHQDIESTIHYIHTTGEEMHAALEDSSQAFTEEERTELLVMLHEWHRKPLATQMRRMW